MLSKKTQCGYLSLLIVFFLWIPARSTWASIPYYFSNRLNYLSLKQVNAITFEAPITQINYPGKQILLNPHGKPALSYTNDHKTVIFLLNKTIKPKEAVQFMVSLKNGDLFSLHFKAQHTLSEVIKVVRPHPLFQKKNTPVTREKLLHHLIQHILVQGQPDSSWHRINKPLHRASNTSKIIHWPIGLWEKSGNQLLQLKICSQKRNPIILHLIKKPNQACGFLSAQPIERFKLMPGHCIDLLTLQPKNNDPASQKNHKPFILLPYREKEKLSYEK